MEQHGRGRQLHLCRRPVGCRQLRPVASDREHRGNLQSRSGEAIDLAGNTAGATVGGINIDKTPPVITGLPANCVLWPANHKLVLVGTASVTDALSGLLPGSFIVTGASSEPPDGTGDGRTNPDIEIIGGVIRLRAERAGNGPGRQYQLGSDGGGSRRERRHRSCRVQRSPQPEVSSNDGGQRRLPRLSRNHAPRLAPRVTNAGRAGGGEPSARRSG